MIDFEQWEGFEGRIWKEEVNVRDFIQKNGVFGILWGIIREIVNGVFRVAIGVIVAILSTIAFFGFILWLFTL